MAFVTYDDLVATIAAWLNRSDLTGRIPDFIRLAEARMQRELTPFSTRTEFSFPLSATTGRTAAIPSLAGVVEFPFVGFNVFDAALTFNPARPLPQVSETVLLTYHRDFPGTGAPEAYAILGQTIAVYPFPNVPKNSLGVDSNYTIIAVLVGPTLSFAVPINSGNAANNPVYADYPDLYLYGALCEAAPYLQHDERMPVWEGRFRQIAKDVNRQHDRLLAGPRPSFQPLARVF